jgi:hypothetical protein
MIGGCGAMPEKTRQLWVIVGLSYFEGNACYSRRREKHYQMFFPQARQGVKLKSFGFKIRISLRLLPLLRRILGIIV